MSTLYTYRTQNGTKELFWVRSDLNILAMLEGLELTIIYFPKLYPSGVVFYVAA